MLHETLHAAWAVGALREKFGREDEELIVSVLANQLTHKRIEYSQRWADLICELVIDGKSLRTICLADDMPSRTTVLKWLNDHEEFASQYTRAREAQQDTYAEEIIHIADTEQDANKARVRIDARKWHASKMAPKKYGDKVEVDQRVTGSLVHKVERIIVRPDAADSDR